MDGLNFSRKKNKQWKTERGMKFACKLVFLSERGNRTLGVEILFMDVPWKLCQSVKPFMDAKQ